MHRVIGTGLFFSSLVLFGHVNSQVTDCLLPTCTLTTTTTTDVLTLATVVDLTTTITVSQAIVLQCVNTTSTETILTSTCTACFPTKHIDKCGFTNGGFVVLFEPHPFLGQVEACRALGMDMAEVRFENLPVAAEVARKCLGQQRLVYIKSYEGEAKPCLALNTGSGKHDREHDDHDHAHQRGHGATVEIVCCSQPLPVLCQMPRQPDCKPECDAHGCHCHGRPWQPANPMLK